ncbi:MAG TPA: hypothetical protein PKO36_01855 [Candidatus Hydrogenedentes bacterium]|nr:hypothetical protein [Candidatus Hydrogenedentota bacterium]
MTIILIANVGQRDLSLDEKALASKDPERAENLRRLREEKRIREWGRLIAKDYVALAPFLDAPMLCSALDSLAKRGERLNEIVLVATKQRDKEFMKGDTFVCAEVLTQLLPDKYAGLIGDARLRVQTLYEPPHDLNAMLDEYGALCSTIDADLLFALCTGGTPACNMALSLRAIEKFGERCVTLHVPEGASEPLRLNVVEYVLARQRRHALRRLVERRDFDAIVQNSDHSETVRALAKAAAARMNLDFEQGLYDLQKLKTERKLEGLEELFAEARLLSQGSRVHVLREVYWSAVTKWRLDECADFLGRAWRLLEASLYRVIARITGLEKDDGLEFKISFEAWANASEQSEYAEYVRKKFDKKSKKAQPLACNVGVLSASLSFFENHPDTIKKAGFNLDVFQRFHAVVKQLRPLADLRNQCVIAHGFEGLSKKKLLETVKFKQNDDQILDVLAELLLVQGITLGTDPYQRFADAIVSLEADER